MRKDTKARDFTRVEKIAIAQRDSIDGWTCCVFCGAPAPAPLAWSNAHYISRAQGGLGIAQNGLGIAQNGLTLCPRCHNRYDQTTARMEMRAYFREYLMGIYPGWNENDLIYRKENT